MVHVDVLNHGYVKLVESMGSDLSIVRAARVSYNADWRVGDDTGSDERLIKYLWDHHHTSPFEAVTFTFEVKAPIFVFRQWHRHRTWSFNEISARYTQVEDEFYVPEPSAVGVQSTTNKQARIITGKDDDSRGEWAALEIESVCESAFEHYQHLIDRGVPRELARIILPFATYSRMFATVNLLNLFKFMSLREDTHAQYEIQVYAKAMHDLIRSVVPVAVKAWESKNDNPNR